MTKVYDFEKVFIKNVIKKYTGSEEQNSEIYLTVLKFIYANIKKTMEDPMEEMSLDSSLKELFEGSRIRFAATFSSLVQYWELNPLSSEDIPRNNEFERFPTVKELCIFIKEKLNNKETN